MDKGFYPGSGPLDGGKTLHPAFDCIDMGVVLGNVVISKKFLRTRKDHGDKL